ncbi:MAG: hypothetical protein ACLGH8_08475 [Bacteroidia bacterium]
MKYLALPAALILLISCQGNLKEKMKPEHAGTDWAYYKLNGDIHTISERSVKISNGTATEGIENSTEMDYDRTFDDFGNLIHEKKWAKKDIPYEELISERRDAIIKRSQYTAGKLTIITTNEWDAAKEHLSDTKRSNPDDTQIDREAFIYKDGRLTSKTKYNSQDIAIEKTVYTYNKKGNLVQEDIYPNAISAEFTIIYAYDKNNNKTLVTRTGKSSPLQKTAYAYNGNKVTGITSTNGKGETSYTEALNYDSKGNVIQHSTAENASGSKTSERFQYDSKNNTTKWQTVTDSDPEVTITNTYDAENNLTGTKTLIGTEVFDNRTYIYEYDTMKNWIKKTVNIKGIKSFEVTRTITYF